MLLKAIWLALEKGDRSAAASFAREASPYVHAKLSSVDLNATVKRCIQLVKPTTMVWTVRECVELA